MSKTKRNPSRSQVNVVDTWDLKPLYKSDAAWQRAFTELEKGVTAFERYRGKLGTSAKVLRACCDTENELDQLAERLSYYAFLKSAEDVANSTYQGMVGQFMNLATRVQEATSFISPEIQSIPKAKMSKMLKSSLLKDYRYALEKLLRYRPHILSQKEERLLAMQGEVSGTARKVFDQLHDADMKFGTLKDENGRETELTNGSFRVFLDSSKRSLRKKASEQFYAAYGAHENSLAATLSSSVLQDVYQARVRNHPSALEGALFSDDVPVSVYTNLIDTVHNHLGTVHRYLDVRRKALKVKELHFYDTYVPIVEMPRPKYPYQKAADTIVEAFKPLGTPYCKALKAGLDGRWVDRYENQGKRSGAFSAGGYVGPPYMLMNYQAEGMDSMFTLAHEAGHSMHTYYSARNQPYQYYGYTIFVAEVASTFNEMLLFRHLFDKAKNKTMRAFLINKQIDDLRATIVRQTMFAEYEKIIHEAAEAGEPLTLERLKHDYRGLLEAYFGPKFVIDDILELESLRIPHFYSAFYVYKYATGMSAAIALSKMVLKGGAKERDRYLNFLKSGGSKFPLELLRDAGVDMSKPEPVDVAMQHFAGLVDELESLI